jgi:hypothetical protein
MGSTDSTPPPRSHSLYNGHRVLGVIAIVLTCLQVRCQVLSRLGVPAARVCMWALCGWCWCALRPPPQMSLGLC